MKKIFAFFMIFAFVVPCVSMGAVNVKNSGIKKAAPVATKQANKIESATSLLPTVIGLVGSVQALHKQQQQLSADCAPTSSELQLVNDLVKEVAKTGVTTASSARGGIQLCRGNGSTNWAEAVYNNNGSTNEGYYESFIQNNYDSNDTCIETFSTQASENTIWAGYPKASKAQRYEDGNTKNSKYVSNVYDVFAFVQSYFSDEDFTVSESAKIAQFKAKAERCAPFRINAAKAEMYSNFVTQTLGNIGQNSGASGTAAVLETVSSMGGTGNVTSMLPSLGTMATQLLDK